jgi:hypothetical protein
MYIKRLLKTVYYLVSDFYVLFYLMYGIAAFVAMQVSQFFFFFHILDILVRYPVLLNVIRSVWEPRE